MSSYALGARVRYHHRAAVARWMTRDMPSGVEGRWGLFEGAHKHRYSLEDNVHEIDRFADRPKIRRGGIYQKALVNKTVMVWPEDGVGVIIGQVRRQRGTSHRSSTITSGPYGEPDYDPGYFDAAESFDLYAIRHDLRGTDYILVPTWAVSPDFAEVA